MHYTRRRRRRSCSCRSANEESMAVPHSHHRDCMAAIHAYNILEAPPDLEHPTAMASLIDCS